jgi:hypothetical protein
MNLGFLHAGFSAAGIYKRDLTHMLTYTMRPMATEPGPVVLVHTYYTAYLPCTLSRYLDVPAEYSCDTTEWSPSMLNILA